MPSAPTSPRSEPDAGEGERALVPAARAAAGDSSAVSEDLTSLLRNLHGFTLRVTDLAGDARAAASALSVLVAAAEQGNSDSNGVDEDGVRRSLYGLPVLSVDQEFRKWQRFTNGDTLYVKSFHQPFVCAYTKVNSCAHYVAKMLENDQGVGYINWYQYGNDGIKVTVRTVPPNIPSILAIAAREGVSVA